MKKSIILSLVTFVTLCLCASVSAQTIRRVNKTPGLNDPAIYTSVQAAHDASADGDIIYVEPTDVDNGVYGDVTFNRRVTLIGTGYDLRTTPNTSFDKRQVSIFYNINFENGSAGSLVMGMTVYYINIRDINCTVTRCVVIGGVTMERAQTLLGGVYSYGNNPTITNCRLNYISGGQATNAIISNNIGDLTISELTGAVINYNTIYCSNSVRFNNVDGSTITNNIFDARDRTLGYSVMDGASNGTTVSNNLCTNIAGLPTGGGNVNSTNPNLVFITANPWTVSPYIDNNIQLATSSPAKTVGPGSTPIGAFAGNNPYVLSGIPNVPVITTFFNTGAGTTATPLNVTISVRSAN